MKTRSISTVPALLCVLVLGLQFASFPAVSAAPAHWTQVASLTASDGLAGDQFGWSLASSGDTLVVGAPRAVFPGCAFVFVRPGVWNGPLTQVATLSASDGALQDNFGISVAISGDTIVVGANYADVNGINAQGAVYIFVKPPGGWSGSLTETAKLTVPSGVTGAWFGRSVATNGSAVVVGMPENDGYTLQGMAFVFTKPAGGWGSPITQVAKLTASDGAAFDEFGWSVAMDGNTIAVASIYIYSPDRTDGPGESYVFSQPDGVWSDRTETARLIASDRPNFYYSPSIAIHGDVVVVGAYSANAYQGAAYVFVRPAAGWSNMNETAQLTASDGAPNDQLGASVAIDDDLIVAGANKWTVHETGGPGAAYVFTRPSEGWSGGQVQAAKLTALDGAANNLFGNSVGVSGESVFAGAYHTRVGANDIQGKAYVFAPQQLVYLPLVLR